MAEATLGKRAAHTWKTTSYVTLNEYGHNMREGLTGKSEVAQDAYEEDRWVDWNEVRILEIEIKSRYNGHVWCVSP